MTDRDDRRLFADGLLYDVGEWVMSQEWIAHKSLDLPLDWLDSTQSGRHLKARMWEYLAAAEDGQSVAFGEPYEVVGNGTWTYQDALGHEPFGINADVREFFEARVPDGQWLLATAHMVQGDGPIYALAHPEDGVRVVVAGYDPRVGEVAA